MKTAATFPGSPEEVKLDKLLRYFERIAALYEMGVINLEDLALVEYKFLRINHNKSVQDYYAFLDVWGNESGARGGNFESVRKVAKLLEEKDNRHSWFGTAIVIGVLYCVIGIVFALPSNQVLMWRLAAWVVSAALYTAHIAYEHLRLRNSSRSMALHVAVAVAIGGFGLAVAALIHSLFAPPSYTRWRFGLALVAWPIITALPAFIVALVIAWVLSNLPTKRLAE